MFTVYNEQQKGKRRIGKILIFLLLLLLITGIAYFLVSHYQVKTVYVDGNMHYTDEEIQNIVMDGPLSENSLYLSSKFKNKGLNDIPFIDTIDVNILAPDTIRITVYEKALAGFVEYLGKYMYFDKDGTVIESSTVKTKGVMQITGLSFEYVVLGKMLPIEDENIFRLILDTGKLLTKYDLEADKLHFDSDYNLTIFFGDVRVRIGDSEMLDEKLMVLPQMLPALENKSGVLRMENYSDNIGSITFEPDTLENKN